MPARKATTSFTDEAILSDDDLAGVEVRKADPKVAKSATTLKAGTKRKATTSSKESRQALKDRTNLQIATHEETKKNDGDRPAAKRSKTDKAATRPKAADRVMVEDIIPDTQQDSCASERIEETMEISEPAPTVTLPRTSNTRLPSASIHRAGSARAGSVAPSHIRERSGSASGNDRDRRSDAELRRQLTAKTRECENLELKFQALEDLVKTRAESNFEKLKAEADQKTRRADDLIASLRKEIAALRKSCSSTSTESSSLQKQVQILSSNRDELTLQVEQLTSECARFKAGLQASEKDKQAVEMKLMAARQQVGGSDAKSSGNRTIPVGASDAYREVKMKENLYTDLTGLIIRGVKRNEGEDEYDCIQTGRNGTLHFHLSVVNETGTRNPKTPSAYEEAEFSYEPFLDDSRDRELLAILPDYLSEDICFPRNHAVKFYTKVVESMTKRVVVEDGED